jgi:hypothetical protein
MPFALDRKLNESAFHSHGRVSTEMADHITVPQPSHEHSHTQHIPFKDEAHPFLSFFTSKEVR